MWCNYGRTADGQLARDKYGGKLVDGLQKIPPDLVVIISSLS